MNGRSMIILLATLRVVPCGAQTIVHAKDLWEDSSAKQIIARYRTSPSALTPILRQEMGAQASSKLDEIADSLVRMVTAVPRDAKPGYWMGPLFALADAGRHSERPDGTPYLGTLDRLIRIHQEAPIADQGLRRSALHAMISVPQHAEMLAYLRRVAVSQDSSARFAMQDLIDEIRPETLRYKEATAQERAATEVVLRALWQTASREAEVQSSNWAKANPPGKMVTLYEWKGVPSVPDPKASDYLLTFGRRSGW